MHGAGTILVSDSPDLHPAVNLCKLDRRGGGEAESRRCDEQRGCRCLAGLWRARCDAVNSTCWWKCSCKWSEEAGGQCDAHVIGGSGGRQVAAAAPGAHHSLLAPLLSACVLPQRRRPSAARGGLAAASVHARNASPQTLRLWAATHPLQRYPAPPAPSQVRPRPRPGLATVLLHRRSPLAAPPTSLR